MLPELWSSTLRRIDSIGLFSGAEQRRTRLGSSARFSRTRSVRENILDEWRGIEFSKKNGNLVRPLNQMVRKKFIFNLL